MDSIQINTGEKRLMVNDDPSRVIVFNPQDITFVERLQSLYKELNSKQNEFEKRAKELDKVAELDEYDIPVNADAKLTYLRDLCSYMRGKIDDVFGAGTSQAAFGDTMNLEVFDQFFDGIMPYVEKVRAEKIEKYTTDASAKRRGRKGKK